MPVVLAASDPLPRRSLKGLPAPVSVSSHVLNSVPHHELAPSALTRANSSAALAHLICAEPPPQDLQVLPRSAHLGEVRGLAEEHALIDDQLNFLIAHAAASPHRQQRRTVRRRLPTLFGDNSAPAGQQLGGTSELERGTFLAASFGKSPDEVREAASALYAAQPFLSPSPLPAPIPLQPIPKQPLLASVSPARAALLEKGKPVTRLEVKGGLRSAEDLRSRARDSLLMSETLTHGSLRRRDGLGGASTNREDKGLLSPRQEADSSVPRGTQRQATRRSGAAGRADAAAAAAAAGAEARLREASGWDQNQPHAFGPTIGRAKNGSALLGGGSHTAASCDPADVGPSRPCRSMPPGTRTWQVAMPEAPSIEISGAELRGLSKDALVWTAGLSDWLPLEPILCSWLCVGV